MAYSKKRLEADAGNLAVLKKRIKEKRFSGAYVFYGDEDYTKTHYYDALVAGCGCEKINVSTFSDTDFSVNAFCDACDTSAVSMDLFSAADTAEEDGGEKTPFRVVRVISPRLDLVKKKEEDAFLERVRDPAEGTVIVFWLYPDETEKLSGRLFAAMQDDALFVNFKREPVGSPALVTWILRHFVKAGLDVPRDVASFLCAYVGNDMTTLKNAVENCIGYLQYEKRTTLTEEDVRFLCRQALSGQIFDISSFALKGKYASAMKALRAFRADGGEVMPVFGVLSKAVYELCLVDKLSCAGLSAQEIAAKAGIPDFVVRSDVMLLRERNGTGDSYARLASEWIKEYEIRLKNSRTGGFALMEELIARLALTDA